MLSEEYINSLLKNWINSSEGQKYINQKTISGYDKTTQIAIAMELKIDLLYAMQQLVKGFNSNPALMNISENRIDIVFPSQSLFRSSLIKKNGQPTGSGVYDIVGLFTQGWSYSKKRPFGHWKNKENLGIIGAKTSRKSNMIISNTINNFQTKYPNVLVNYPNRWK